VRIPPLPQIRHERMLRAAHDAAAAKARRK